MSVYLDTSLIVASLTNEDATESAQTWLAAHAAEDLTISEWVITEVSSALSLKLRTRQLGPDHRAQALGHFHKLVSDSLRIAPVLSTHFRVAAAIANRHELGLRAADALHLAICADYGAALATLDEKLARAAPLAGVMAELVWPDRPKT